MEAHQHTHGIIPTSDEIHHDFLEEDVKRSLNIKEDRNVVEMPCRYQESIQISHGRPKGRGCWFAGREQE